MASHSSILAWRIPTDRGAWRGRKESEATEHVTQETVYVYELGYSQMPSCLLWITEPAEKSSSVQPSNYDRVRHISLLLRHPAFWLINPLCPSLCLRICQFVPSLEHASLLSACSNPVHPLRANSEASMKHSLDSVAI